MSYLKPGIPPIDLRQSQDNNGAMPEEVSLMTKVKNYVFDFFGRHKKIILSAATIIMMTYLFNKHFYSRLIDSSDIIRMIN